MFRFSILIEFLGRMVEHDTCQQVE